MVRRPKVVPIEILGGSGLPGRYLWDHLYRFRWEVC